MSRSGVQFSSRAPLRPAEIPCVCGGLGRFRVSAQPLVTSDSGGFAHDSSTVNTNQARTSTPVGRGHVKMSPVRRAVPKGQGGVWFRALDDRQDLLDLARFRRESHGQRRSLPRQQGAGY